MTTTFRLLDGDFIATALPADQVAVHPLNPDHAEAAAELSFLFNGWVEITGPLSAPPDLELALMLGATVISTDAKPYPFKATTVH